MYKTLPFLLLAASVQAAELPVNLVWSGRLALAMPVAGVVETVAAETGAVLQQGSLLASLDPVPFKASVVEARADTDRLNEELVDASRDLDRVKELFARTVSATTELDAAKLRQARATSGLAAAQARLEKARWLLQVSELRAPFNLVVLSRKAEPGLVVTSQCQPNILFEVARADELLIHTELDTEQALQLRVGQTLEIEVGGKAYRGHVRSLLAQDGKRWQLEADVPKSAEMYAGMGARLRLP